MRSAIVCLFALVAACTPQSVPVQTVVSPSETPAFPSTAVVVLLTPTRTLVATPTVSLVPTVEPTRGAKATMTEIPESQRVTWTSPDGQWEISQALGELAFQVVNPQDDLKWGVANGDIEPPSGTSVNSWLFMAEALYFGVGPTNYEVEVLRREAPIYSLYRLDLSTGLLVQVLSPQLGSDGFPVYTYFDVSPDERYVVYSRWYSGEVVVRDLKSLEESSVAIPSGYLIAGGFLWSPHGHDIAATIWESAYDVPTRFAVVDIEYPDLTIKKIMEASESDYFLVSADWSENGTLVLRDRQTERYWQLDLATGILVPDERTPSP